MIGMLWLAASSWASPEAPRVLEVTVVTEARLPWIGRSRVRTTSRSLVLPDGDASRVRLCQVEVADDQRLASTVVPEAFVEAHPTQRLRLEIVDGRLSADLGRTRVGFTGEELPTDADDPRVLDFEGDGHPGATVLIEVPVLRDVEVYVVQDGHLRLDGRLDDDGVVRGAVRVERMRQWTLGASHPWFVGNPEVQVVSEESSFELLPAGDARSCGDLRPGAEGPTSEYAAKGVRQPA